MRRKRFWWLVAGAGVAWLLWMTLRRQAQVTAELAYITTPAATHGISSGFLVDFLGNIAVFMPLGVALFFALRGPSVSLRDRCKSMLVATSFGAALSAAIELLQLTIPSRVSTWKDWGLNTLGAAVGALMACGIEQGFGALRHPKDRQADIEQPPRRQARQES